MHYMVYAVTFSDICVEIVCIIDVTPMNLKLTYLVEQLVMQCISCYMSAGTYDGDFSWQFFSIA